MDYTNYLILGITVALAWELPTKPPSELLSDFEESLKDGSFGISRIDPNIHSTHTTSQKLPQRIYLTSANSNTIESGIPNYYNHSLGIPDEYSKPNLWRKNNQPFGFPSAKTSKYNWRPMNKKLYSYKSNPFKDWTNKKSYNFRHLSPPKRGSYSNWHKPERYSNLFELQAFVENPVSVQAIQRRVERKCIRTYKVQGQIRRHRPQVEVTPGTPEITNLVIYGNIVFFRSLVSEASVK